jgi:hypothetical protein
MATGVPSLQLPPRAFGRQFATRMKLVVAVSVVKHDPGSWTVGVRLSSRTHPEPPKTLFANSPASQREPSATPGGSFGTLGGMAGYLD